MNNILPHVPIPETVIPSIVAYNVMTFFILVFNQQSLYAF